MRVITSSRALACLDIFDNLSRIEGVEAPVYIIHGTEDEDVPFEHGLELSKRAGRCRKWWVEGRGHNDCLLDNDEEFERSLADFYQGGMGEPVKKTTMVRGATTEGSDDEEYRNEI